MAERAHPDLPGFRDKWNFHLRKGIVPWISIQRSPYREAFLWRYKWVNAYCKGQDVLDIPCGMGWGTSLLKDCRSRTGIDISNEAIVEARQRYGNLQTRFLVGNMEKLELDDYSFDIVVCLEGIEHVAPEVGEAFIAEAARVLRPEGKLFLSSPYCRTKAHSGNPYHIKEYRPDELKALVETHFNFVETIERDVDDLTVSYIQAKRREQS